MCDMSCCGWGARGGQQYKAIESMATKAKVNEKKKYYDCTYVLE